jgi:hypothetical protein
MTEIGYDLEEKDFYKSRGVDEQNFDKRHAWYAPLPFVNLLQAGVII